MPYGIFTTCVALSGPKLTSRGPHLSILNRTLSGEWTVHNVANIENAGGFSELAAMRSPR